MADKSLLQRAKMPIGKSIKKKLDDWLNENINLPLSEEGFEDTGAALSAALSAGGELLIPDDLADAAMAMVPGAKLAKAGKKGLKALKKSKNIPGLEKPGTIDYGSIRRAEKAAADERRKNFEDLAETLEYTPGGDIIRHPSKSQLRKKSRLSNKE